MASKTTESKEVETLIGEKFVPITTSGLSAPDLGAKGALKKGAPIVVITRFVEDVVAKNYRTYIRSSVDEETFEREAAMINDFSLVKGMHDVVLSYVPKYGANFSAKFDVYSKTWKIIKRRISDESSSGSEDE